MSILQPAQLSNTEPLLHSKTRQVFVHPLDRSLLIKVHKKRAAGPAPESWFDKQKDHFLYTSGIMRELKQFVESRYRDYGPAVQYIAPIYGVLDTDLGLGLLMAAARDARGELAPTVRSLLDNNAMTPARRDQLDALLQAILATDLVFGDLNQENIVLDRAGAPEERFVIIDGLGERTWLPVQSWFRAASRRQKRLFVAKLTRRLQHGELSGT